MMISKGHWSFEGFTETMTTKQWREFLLKHGDNKIIVNGRLRTLRAKSLGAGVYQVSKEPLK